MESKRVVPFVVLSGLFVDNVVDTPKLVQNRDRKVVFLRRVTFFFGKAVLAVTLYRLL